MMEENRKHTLIALENITETSANGVYLTKEELRKYGIFAGVMAAVLAFFAVFSRKH
ncbi:MAG: hypothetical protein IJE27_03460 [Anaerotignum sp.]|nr:hypothetical protein [Anaerotignum sp.]